MYLSLETNKVSTNTRNSKVKNNYNSHIPLKSIQACPFQKNYQGKVNVIKIKFPFNSKSEREGYGSFNNLQHFLLPNYYMLSKPYQIITQYKLERIKGYIGLKNKHVLKVWCLDCTVQILHQSTQGNVVYYI